MIFFPQTEELLKLAERTVWFKSPSDALQQPLHFIAHVLTYGTSTDCIILRRYLNDADFKEAIIKAPPGIFDAQSWSYWNIIIGRYPVPPLPLRQFETV